MLLALSEPNTTALLLIVFGTLLAFSAAFSRGLDRLGLPVVLLFLILGMLGGSEGIGGIPFDNYGLAFRLGTIALVLILFDGGLNTSIGSVRRGMAPAGILATFGVAGTAIGVACFARLLGLSWSEAMLLGAVVSSTDAATVFAVLRGSSIGLSPKMSRTLELESGLNDPMAVILTVALTEAATTGKPLGWGLLLDVPLQLIVGAIIGAAIGTVGSILLRRVKPSVGGLYSVLTLALCLLSFGVATVLMGSGFLAVYVAGLVLGHANIPYRNGLIRIHDAMAWLSQTSMFLMLGLLVFPSKLLDVAWIGLGVGLFMAFIGRPLVVWLCLLPFGFKRNETIFLGWVGLRGAVPIILATIPVLASVPEAERLFNIVFFIVVVNAFIPGAFIRWAANKLGVRRTSEPIPSAVLEIHSTQTLRGQLESFYIDKSLATCGVPLSKISFPEGAAAVLLVRANELLACKGDTVLQHGDHLFVFFRPEDRPYIQLLFGVRQRRAGNLQRAAPPPASSTPRRRIGSPGRGHRIIARCGQHQSVLVPLPSSPPRECSSHFSASLAPVSHFSASALNAQIDQHQVIVRAAGCDPVAALRISALAQRTAFFTTCCEYVLNSGRSASPNATAFARMMCISGPPCVPGNTALSIFLAISSSFVRINPPRGPRSVLCVVVVTMCACGNGEGCTPAATSPAMCAMSAISSAPHLIRDCAELREINRPRIRAVAAHAASWACARGTPSAPRRNQSAPLLRMRKVIVQRIVHGLVVTAR
jgi:potassium/hydrogen antiporter